jgi:hypothetical protein
MVSPIHSVTPAQPVNPTPTAQPAPSAAKPQASAQDTVHISNAATALLQESLETSVQTAKEASAGDPQAIRLQARHAHAKVHTK